MEITTLKLKKTFTEIEKNMFFFVQTWWTNTSSVPSSGVMKPQPFNTLNHLHVPRRKEELVPNPLSVSMECRKG